jgi:hypothetical protein
MGKSPRYKRRRAKVSQFLPVAILLTLATLPPPARSATAHEYDVVVYGGTAGGAATAVAAARQGAKVALLEPGRHLGGMVSGGLGWTDFGRQEVIGGISREFFERVGRHYGQAIAWYFEPHVGEQVFQEMIAEAKVAVFLNHRLRENAGVRKSGARILELVTENGERFRAKIFADCSYEGDLMAQAKITYTWGREAIAQYNESLAGVRDRTPLHQFTVQISPFDSSHHLLPEIYDGPKGEVGAGDKKVQAYNFRICMTDNQQNLVPFPRPASYDPKRYALLARMLQAMTEKNGCAPRMNEVMKPDPLPNRKTDTNNNGAFSTDYIGGSWGYPEADYRTREEIWQQHKDYAAGFLYFLANDPDVPAALQKEVSRWGLAKDEFTDTANWPRQLYVREARRMVGEFVMTQRDIQTELTKPDAIGMGSYNSDSHNVQRVVTPGRAIQDGATPEGLAVENEGDMQVRVQPYQIPYRILVPKRSEAINLLVPVCFSASHVAYSTLRMEPQYMIVGQAAGIAATLAIKKRIPLQDVAPNLLIEKLRQQNAVLELAARSHN